jgi:hypothetical protein
MKFEIIGTGAYYDFPRQVDCFHEGNVYYFECEFDEVNSHYSETFNVELWANTSPEKILSGNFRMIFKFKLIQIPVNSIHFDKTKKEIIHNWLSLFGIHYTKN